MCKKIEVGIHTYSLYHKISYSEAQSLIESLRKRGYYYPLKDNKWIYNGTYKSNLYADLGVQIYIYRYYDYSGFSLCITPCSLLKGIYAAADLYQPTSKNNRELMDKLNDILDDLDVKSDSGKTIRADEMSVCRADPCINLYLNSDDELLEYLRILKKSALISHYNADKFERTSSRVKNIKEANTHSYRIKSKKATFTAYDKIYEMQQSDRCPDDLNDAHILRIEAELKRDALLKRLDKNATLSNEKLLKSTEENAVRILVNFLEGLKFGTCTHIRYCNTETRIKEAKLEDKIKDRMLYLILKTSDGNLSSALKKLCSEYNLNYNQCERILKQFDELCISPVTLQNDSQFESLPSLISLLKRYQPDMPKRDNNGFYILEPKGKPTCLRNNVLKDIGG